VHVVRATLTLAECQHDAIVATHSGKGQGVSMSVCAREIFVPPQIASNVLASVDGCENTAGKKLQLLRCCIIVHHKCSVPAARKRASPRQNPVLGSGLCAKQLCL